MSEPAPEQAKGKCPPPAALCLLVCDDMIIDQETGKHSLIGIFDRIGAPQFPARHHRLSLYIELTNGHGQYDIKVGLMDVKADEEVISIGGPMSFPDPLAVVKMRLRLNNVVFPRFSEYRFQVWANNELLMERRLIVSQISPEEPKNEAAE